MPKVPRFVIFQVAGAVPADLETVYNVIAGKPVRGSVGHRVREDLRRRGYDIPEVMEPKTKRAVAR